MANRCEAAPLYTLLNLCIGEISLYISSGTAGVKLQLVCAHNEEEEESPTAGHTGILETMCARQVLTECLQPQAYS